MNFGDAIHSLKEGYRVNRAGWNGKGMWLCYTPGGTFREGDLIAGDLGPFIVMKTAQDTFVPWLASQSDMLADDWERERKPQGPAV